MGAQTAHRADRSEIVRLVKRRKRAQRLEFGKQRIVHERRRSKLRSAVDDTVPDGHHLAVSEMVDRPGEQVFQQIGMG